MVRSSRGTGEAKPGAEPTRADRGLNVSGKARIAAKSGAALLADDEDSANLPADDSHGTKPSNEPLPENERPFGRYTLLRRLAYGGMGEIFLARQGGAGSLAPVAKLVVIKRILSHMRRDEKHRRMFLDEARLQAMLTNQHVVQIHDMGEENGHVYLAMEHVHGPSWRALIDRCRRLRIHVPLADVAAMVSQACRGLGYAHNLVDVTGSPLHIVHRDINPHNILVTYDGDVKIIDFGIAKSDLAEGNTETGTIKGKFSYMSPEQSAALPLDNRSDLFALGICLYELLTNENPFRKGNVVLSLESIQREAPPPLDRKRRDAAAFQAVVDRCLAKDKRDRYDDGADIARALDAVVASGAVPPADQPISSWLRELFADEIAAHVQILEQTGSAGALKVRSNPNHSSSGPRPGRPSDASKSNPVAKRSREALAQQPTKLARAPDEGLALPDASTDKPLSALIEESVGDLPDITAESKPNELPRALGSQLASPVAETRAMPSPLADPRLREGETSSTPAPLQTLTGGKPLRDTQPQQRAPHDDALRSIADDVEPVPTERAPIALAFAVVALAALSAVGVVAAVRTGLVDRLLDRIGTAHGDDVVAVGDPPPEPPATAPPEPPPTAPAIPIDPPPATTPPVIEPPPPATTPPVSDPPPPTTTPTTATTAEDPEPAVRKGPRRKPERDKPEVEKESAKPVVGTLLVTSEGYQVKGGRKLPLGGATTLAIDDANAPYQVKVRVRSDSEGKATFDVDAEPWAIVRVDGVGRGKSPQRGITLGPSQRVELELTNPKAGTMKMSLTLAVK